jgi:penicillin-binding protein 1A
VRRNSSFPTTPGSTGAAAGAAPKTRAIDLVEGEARENEDDVRARRLALLRRIGVWALRIGLALLALGVAGLIALFVFVRNVEATLPEVVDLKGNYHPPQVTRVLARDGTLLAELFVERRTVVPIKSLPAHVKLAVLAAEDAGFYEHEGLNYLGIVRAFVVNMRSGRTRQGGSTITQQVVKNLLLDPERTYKRKLREALLSRRIEQELSKDDILELYLNHIYFGHGRYGIEEAARDLFGKPARELTIAEAALLAGLPAGPELFSPKRDLKKSLTRRAFVLGQMREKGFLQDAAYEQAMNEPVHLSATESAQSELAPEAVEIARKLLHKLEPERAAKGGYVITTTIDPKLQAAARKALREGIGAYDKRKNVLGPIKVPVPDKKGHVVKPSGRELSPDALPERNKTYVGSVVSADDLHNTIDVKIGAVTGIVRLADFERYNPQKLVASAFAPPGSFVRVTMLGAIPEPQPVPTGPDAGAPVADAGTNALASSKVPLRLELGPEGALVAVDVRSRHVVALVGSYEGESGALDRATQAHRQPGSTFKPIVYAQALRTRRFTPASLIDVTPGTFAGGYKPSNYEGWKDSDPLRLREVLANSVNVAAVRVIEDIGPAGVVELAHALGIESTLKPDLSLALGSYEVSPLELCGAYATLAAGGTYDEPQVVLKIVGPDGAELALPRPPPARRVLEEPEAYLTTSLLTSVVDHGTGQKAKELARPVAGKTGTSNGSKDTWFAGFSTDIAAVVWLGYDDGNLLGRGETGGTTALPAWISFMKVAFEGRARTEFPRPPGIAQISIDKRTGQLPYEGDVDVMDELFLQGTEPKDVAPSPAAAAPTGAPASVVAPDAPGDTVLSP